ncbi:acylneuraminate cytidylyltransferase family protein [Gammaproteobacteria bacterium]|nr:acylneuraminate cytidylyltransferase family protein [Gammaproteobacteria bacterium]
MKTTKKVVAIIPARGGSQGLPGKNIANFCGKPLIAHTIEAAVDCPNIDRVIVTTDSDNIATVARKWGAEVPFMRPAELATSLATTEETLQHTVLWLDENENYHTDIVVFLACTNVFRKQEWVNEVVYRMLNKEALDTVFVAYATHKNFWRKEADRYCRLAPDLAYASRQVREPLFREDTGIACATRADICRQGNRVGGNVDILVTNDERTGIDIHTTFDIWLAETVMREWPMDIAID